MFQQPIAQQVSNIKVPDAVKNSVAAVRNTVSNSMNEFSSRAVSTSSAFLTSNSIIARIAFIFLVLLGFIFLFRLGVSLIVYFMGPSQNPYLVKGMIPGNAPYEFPQDTLVANAVPIQRSDNKPAGIEFTWSVWLNVSAPPAADVYQHVFHKGDKKISSDPTSGDYNNSPGVYLYRPSVSTANSSTSDVTDNLHIIILMSSFDTTKKLYEIDIDNIPLKKWVHLAVRMENNIMDVYVNGTISQRTIFSNTVPRQNYGSIYVCQPVGTSGTAGFSGYLSDLRYFSSALNVFAISSITAAGPNLKASKLIGSGTANSGTSYLSSTWFSSKY